MKNNLQMMSLGETTIKIREPEVIDQNTPVIMMLHGYTGDASSMWVFSSKLSENVFIISPRAPYASRDNRFGGYTWVDQSIMQWPIYQDFFSSAQILESLLDDLAGRYPDLDFDKLNLVGFSQGGAMAIVFASTSKRRVEKIALLSSFIPDGSEGFLSKDRFANIDIFIGHGNKDDTVPIEKAREAENLLLEKGANTTVCYTDVGHQLGSDCFNAFGRFFRT
jgi:phospholipase/carboxylesterase